MRPWVVLTIAACGVGCGKKKNDDCAPPEPLVVQEREAPAPIDCTGQGDHVFESGVLHRIDLTLSKADWSALRAEAEAFSEDECEPRTYFPATIRYDDLSALDKVGVRLKGNHSLGETGGTGPLPLKVDLDRFDDGQTLDGLNKLNLHAVVTYEGEGGWEWPSDPVADVVSYTAMREHGAPTSRAVLAEVFVNGRSQGLYSVVEQIDGRFVRCTFSAPFGDLYKPGHDLSWSPEDRIEDQGGLDFQWPDASDHAAVRGLLEALNDGDEAALAEALDIDSALTYFALNIGLGNWDYYTFIAHNYYLYEAQPGQFAVLPWDMNMSQTDWTEPCGVGAGSAQETPLSARLLRDPVHVARYRQILGDFLTGAGSVEAQHSTIDGLEPLVKPWVTGKRLDRMRANIARRVSGMAGELEGLDRCPRETDAEF